MMETGVKIVAVIFLLTGASTAAFGGLGFLFGNVKEEERVLMGVLVALVVGFGALLAAVGVGLWRRLQWARRPAILLAGLLLISGVGLLPAIFTLVVLLHPKGRALFEPEAAGVEGSAPSLD